MKAKEIIKKYRLDKKTYTHKGFHGNLFFFFPVGEQALKPLKKYYGDSHKITIFFFKNNYGDWHWNNEDMVRLRNSFIDKMNKNPRTLKKLLEDWHKKLYIFNKIMKKIDRTDIAKLSDSKLLSLYYEWYNAYIDEYGIAIGIQDAFSMHAENFLIPHFKQVIEEKGYHKKFDDYFLTLTSPVDESFITREYKERLKLLKKPKKDIERHAKKYHWLQNNYAMNIYLDADYFSEQLGEISGTNVKKELKRLSSNISGIKIKKKSLIKKLKLGKKSINLIKITEAFAYMQDERKKYVLMASHYHSLFMEEAGRRIGFERELMEYTFIHELRDILKGKISRKLLKERKNGVLVIQTLKGYEVFSGKAANYINDNVLNKEKEKSDYVKGTVACKGRIKGRAKIVLKIHDIVNVEEGDVLIASMTRPEFIPAMKKASAIVTDEGGITSHAAVVSRELKKPCVIGTKRATKIFDDGEIIEVNAITGVVRRV